MVNSNCRQRAYRLATTWPKGGLGVASAAARDAIPPVPPKTAKSGPQTSKSAIENHLRFAESFRVHGPISTSESAAVSTPSPRNNSLRYRMVAGPTWSFRRHAVPGHQPFTAFPLLGDPSRLGLASQRAESLALHSSSPAPGHRARLRRGSGEAME